MHLRHATLACAFVLASAGCSQRPPQPDASDAVAPGETSSADRVTPDDAADARADMTLDSAPDATLPDATLPDGDTPDTTPSDAVTEASPDAAPMDGASDVSLEDVPIFTDAACGATFNSYPDMPAFHVAEDAGLTFVTNPPAGGDHFDRWARWGLHSAVVPRGHWIHNLEHGGVVILYRCAGDCASTRAALEAVVAALPPEPRCTSKGEGVRRRVVLTEDPLLDVPVAAAAWSWTYRANCVDPSSLTAFVIARTGRAPEDFCWEGSYP